MAIACEQGYILLATDRIYIDQQFMPIKFYATSPKPEAEQHKDPITVSTVRTIIVRLPNSVPKLSALPQLTFSRILVSRVTQQPREKFYASTIEEGINISHYPQQPHSKSLLSAGKRMHL